ncbi:MAG: HYR domain-containing protein [Microthrixaceae bacterium]
MRGTVRVAAGAAVLAGVVLLAGCFPQPPDPDLTPPVLSLPASFTVVATEPTGADVQWSATATDAVDGERPVTCTPPPGRFPLGTTSVSCTASDAAGNTASGAFDVTVVGQDLTPPVLSLPTGVTTEATGPQGAEIAWSATATDDVDGDTPVACSPAPGVFALGVTSVVCSATDDAGNSATGAFDVSVVDTTVPTLVLPSEVTAAASGPTGAVVSWLASASDLVDGEVPVTCDPPTGQFPLGATLVSCTAIDLSGNSVTGTFEVTVESVDDAPPTLGLPIGIIVEATGPEGAPVTWSATAEDEIDGAITPSCTPEPGLFALGTTTVSCSATDAAGNTATGSFDVSVVDTTSPTLTLPSGLTVIAPDGSGAQVTWSATATDLVDGSVAVSCAPAPGLFAPGVTEVSCSATDAAGNAAAGTFTVTVTVDPGTGVDTFDVESDDSFGATVAGGPISRQLIAPGIGQDLEWAVVGGAFPAGVSLSPSGLLSGTPAAPGLWSVDLSATPTGAPPAAGRMAAAATPLTLWGYVISAPTSDPFPATLTSARARSDALVAASFGSGGAWSLPSDGSASSTVSPTQLAADVGVAGLGQPGTFPWRWRGLIERGRWLTISPLTPAEAEHGWINSCRYDLWDLTQTSPTKIGSVSSAFPDIEYFGGDCWGDVSEDGSTIVRVFIPWPEDFDDPVTSSTIRFASSATGATQRVVTVPDGWSLGSTLLAPDGSALVHTGNGTSTTGETLRLTGRSASGDGTRPLPSECFVIGQSDGWDGGRIIVACGGAGGSGIGTVDVATGQDLRLVATDFTPFQQGFVSISPDGSEIAFAASAPGGLQTINVLDTTEQEVRVLTEPFPGGLLFPLFVP